MLRTVGFKLFCANFAYESLCSRPELGAIIQDLELMQQQPATGTSSENAILLLSLLLPLAINDEARAKILVPDQNHHLLPVDTVYYNDVNDADFIDVHIAHPAITRDLADKLGMGFLGLKFAGLQNPGRDMGEDPTTTIRNRLREYTDKQFLTEFVANAADAGATEFSIFLDEHQSSGGGVLPGLGEFQACPSLVIHNDTTFTDKDFDGICDTGIGGKRDRTDSIGQFGSGALTMFHFSEVGCVFLPT